MKLCSTCRNAGLCVIRSKLEEQQVLKFPDEKVAIAEMNIESCDHYEQKPVEQPRYDVPAADNGVADVVAAVLRQMQQNQAPRAPVPPGDTSGVPMPRQPQSPTSPPPQAPHSEHSSFEDMLQSMPGGAAANIQGKHVVTVAPDGTRKVKINLQR